MRNITKASYLGVEPKQRLVADLSAEAPQQAETQGIVLAGTHAWGRCPLESVICRPLMPIAARPLLWHILAWMGQKGISRATVCGNSDTAAMCRGMTTAGTAGVSLAYSEDAMPRGPAGCLRDAAIDCDADTFVVVDGTILPQADLDALLQAHRESEAILTVVVAGTGEPDGPGRPVRKPVGIYVVSRAVLEEIPATGYQDIKETLIPKLYRREKRVVAHNVDRNQARRVTDAASYLTLSMWAAQRLAGQPGSLIGYERVEESWIHSSAQVHSTARLVGPVLVGPGSVVESEAMVVGPTTIGSECTIGRGAVVSRSAVWDRCRLGPDAVVDQCVLAHDASVDAETALRQTICVVPSRPERSLFDRLARFCRLTRSESRIGATTLIYSLRS